MCKPHMRTLYEYEGGYSTRHYYTLEHIVCWMGGGLIAMLALADLLRCP